MKRIKGKKAAQMTVSTLVIIVLAMVVLVVLVVWFGVGSGNLFSRITNFFSSTNVDAVKQGCQVACTTQSINDYCCQIRDVKFEKGGENEKMTCADSKLKGDCTLSCDVNKNCASLVCPVEAKPTCSEKEEAEPSKKFDKNGNILEEDDICCIKKTESCKGTATPCNELSKRECPTQRTADGKVCSFSDTNDKCTGTLVRACNLIKSSTECPIQKGCSWS